MVPAAVRAQVGGDGGLPARRGGARLVAAYEADLWDIGQQPDHKVLWGARFFCARIGAPAAFNVLPLTDQLGVNVAVHRFVTWLIATRRLRPTADYLVARRPRLGITLSRHWPGFFAAFMATADALGFNVRVAQTQWAMLGQICALIGVAPERLSHADIDAARDACWWQRSGTGRAPGRAFRRRSSGWRRHCSTPG